MLSLFNFFHVKDSQIHIIIKVSSASQSYSSLFVSTQFNNLYDHNSCKCATRCAVRDTIVWRTHTFCYWETILSSFKKSEKELLACLYFRNVVELWILTLGIFYCRIYKYFVITENIGAFSASVLSCLPPPSHCYVCILYEYATNHHGELLDICKFSTLSTF